MFKNTFVGMLVGGRGWEIINLLYFFMLFSSECHICSSADLTTITLQSFSSVTRKGCKEQLRYPKNC